MKTTLSYAAGAVIALTFVGPIAAQTGSATSNNTNAGQVKGIHYVAGGVGLDARAEMQRLAASHNLLVKFAEGDGAYLIPDSVSVRRGAEEVLNVTETGPWLYVNLPNGSYTVAATYKGVVRSKVVNVAGRVPDVVLTWPTQSN